MEWGNKEGRSIESGSKRKLVLKERNLENNKKSLCASGDGL